MKSRFGIENTLALTIMLETGTIKRFDSPGNFSSYCRYVFRRKFICSDIRISLKSKL